MCCKSSTTVSAWLDVMSLREITETEAEILSIGSCWAGYRDHDSLRLGHSGGAGALTAQVGKQAGSDGEQGGRCPQWSDRDRDRVQGVGSSRN